MKDNLTKPSFRVIIGLVVNMLHGRGIKGLVPILPRIVSKGRELVQFEPQEVEGAASIAYKTATVAVWRTVETPDRIQVYVELATHSGGHDGGREDYIVCPRRFPMRGEAQFFLVSPKNLGDAGRYYNEITEKEKEEGGNE